MLSFAFKTLLADRRKMLLAVVGVVFSLVLVNIQGGMFIGMIRKSTLLIDFGKADIWIGHRGVKNADITADIPISWLQRIQSVPGVKRAEPYVVAGGLVELEDGDFDSVMIVGSESASTLGHPWSFAEGGTEYLRIPNAITIDQLDASRLGNPKIGDVLEINDQRARVVAKTDGIVGFITTPYVFTNIDSARRYGKVNQNRCSYYLVSTDGNVDQQLVVDEIRKRLPDADVYTAEDFSWETRMYWILRTGLGMSFGSSTLLGVFVGLVMVAQSLYALVLDHLESFGALKAIGADDRQIGWILIGQGLTIAGIGCVVGQLVTGLLWLMLSSPRLPIAITPSVLLISTTLSTTICLVSALIPLGRIRRVDPVTVLQG